MRLICEQNEKLEEGMGLGGKGRNRYMEKKPVCLNTEL